MATKLKKPWLYKILTTFSKNEKSGFTLIELLVAIIIAALVVSGLLYLVVEMLQLDRREFVLNQTQQDMQRSMEYISSDIQEAVYVYDNADAFVNTNIPSLVANGEIPVLAFWRPDPLSTDNLNAINACTTDECEVLKVRQYTYSLVVYLLRQNNDTTLWGGESRILRYELPKYSNFNPLTEAPGYVDPSIDRPGDDITYANWQPDSTDPLGPPASYTAVLTDYVDETTAQIPNAPDATCSTLGTGYVRTPPIPGSGDPVTSFVACVLQNTGGTGNENQEVYLFLRGNALSGEDRALINRRNQDSDNPALEARVQVRGVLNKQPNTN